ncbi:MAG: hypothetical protein C4346_12195 [Chloroflexota bacterium]
MNAASTTSDLLLVKSLLRPEAYPWKPDRVELIETHISWVFLAGDRVVKVKRPVRFPFVDHTTVDRRRHSCEEEVRLNRRLSSGVYLGVVSIVQTKAGYAVDGKGQPVEWATLMRRLPSDRMLDVLLTRGERHEDLAEWLAHRLVPFHREGAGNCGNEPYGRASALAAVLTDNLAELEPFAGRYFGREQERLVAEAMRRFLAEQEALLERRVKDGWIRDGHGDLRAEHICVEEPGVIQIIDCVEFNPAIRCADVASDLAFLLVDLDRLGAAPIAQELLAAYRAGGVDLPPHLIRLYRAHRALVRVKISCLTLISQHQPHPDLPAEIAQFLNIATRAALTVRPVLIIMTGLSGTGKSVVARALADALGAALFASDAVRKELAGVRGHAPAAWGEGIYQRAWTERTYQRLVELARVSLANRQPVILDATFLESAYRHLAVQVARESGVPLVIVETRCDEDVVVERITRRAAEAGAISDATLAIYQAQRERLATHPPAVPEGALVFHVDTTRDDPSRLDGLFAGLVKAEVIAARLPEQ